MEEDSSYLDGSTASDLASPERVPPPPSSNFKGRLPPPIRTTSSPVDLSSPTSSVQQNVRALQALPNLVVLRDLVTQNLESFAYTSAIYYANILITATDSAPEDVYLLAKSYFAHREFHRALELLRQNDLVETKRRRSLPPSLAQKILLLAGQAYLETEKFEACVCLFMGKDPIGTELSHVFEERTQHVFEGYAENGKTKSAMALMLGKAYEALDNRARAVECYKLALQSDVYCAEAYTTMISHHLLTSVEETKLLEETSFSADDEWLCLMYQSKLLHHHQQQDVEQLFGAVETRCGMATNVDVAVAKANCYLQQHDPANSLKITHSVRMRDPFHMDGIVVHITALVEVGKKSDLFQIAHQLVDAYPTKAVSWFAVGCYYYVVKKYDVARRYFNKATTLEPQFAPAWLGYGNAYAAVDESDQAMAAYRTAARLFPGSHVPLLCSGTEFLRTNNLKLSEQLLVQSSRMCPSDPLVYNELGVVVYKQNRFSEAVRCFEQAIAKSKSPSAAYCANLGHAYRKLGDLDKAVQCYTSAMAIEPRSADVHSAIGLAYHLKGNLIRAIEYYHQALGFRSTDTFTSALLDKALTQASFGDVA